MCNNGNLARGAHSSHAVAIQQARSTAAGRAVSADLTLLPRRCARCQLTNFLQCGVGRYCCRVAADTSKVITFLQHFVYP